MSSTTVPNPANGSFPSRSSRLSAGCIVPFLVSMAMFMLPVTALDVAGIEKKLLQTMEMITAKKRKVSRMVMLTMLMPVLIMLLMIPLQDQSINQYIFQDFYKHIVDMFYV